MPQPHSFTSPRLLVTIPSHFLNLPPQKNPTSKSYMQEYASTSQPPLSKTSCHDSKTFFKPPPPKPYMQEYASTSQLHLSKPSCHDSKSFFKPPPKPYMQEYASTSQTPPPRLLVTIPSHFLNLPPKTIHARVFLNFTASPLQDLDLLDAKSFSNPPPKKNPTCKSIPLSKTSCHESKSFSKPPPQTLHARVCLNFTASPLQAFLSRVQVIF